MSYCIISMIQCLLIKYPTQYWSKPSSAYLEKSQTAQNNSDDVCMQTQILLTFYNHFINLLKKNVHINN